MRSGDGVAAILRQTRIALLFALLPAGAQALTPISQQREVSLAIERETRVCPINFDFPPCPPGPPSQITIENFADAETAPDLADFTATASVPGFASQASLVTTTSASALVAEGSRTGVAPFGSIVDLPGGTITDIYQEHVTSSRYEMSFELTEATSYSLEGTLDLYTFFFDLDEDASLSLIGPGGQVVASLDLVAERDCDLGEPECFLNGSVSESGVLQPGIYTLAAATNGRADKIYRYGDSDSGSFAVSLDLSPPAVPLLPPAVLPLLCALLALATRVRA